MTKVTVGQLLDLMDNSRESEEVVNIMDHNGNVQCKERLAVPLPDRLRATFLCITLPCIIGLALRE